MLGWANSKPWIWAWEVAELVSPAALLGPHWQDQLSHTSPSSHTQMLQLTKGRVSSPAPIFLGSQGEGSVLPTFLSAATGEGQGQLSCSPYLGPALRHSPLANSAMLTKWVIGPALPRLCRWWGAQPALLLSWLWGLFFPPVMGGHFSLN